MDRLVKVGPSAVSTDLVPGRSERPTEPDRDNSVGHSPGGIHTKGHPGTLIIVPPHRGLPNHPAQTLKMEGGDRKEAKKWPVCGVHKRVNE